MASTSIQCPYCRTLFPDRRAVVGTRATCPHCGSTFPVTTRMIYPGAHPTPGPGPSPASGEIEYEEEISLPELSMEKTTRQRSAPIPAQPPERPAGRPPGRLRCRSHPNHRPARAHVEVEDGYPPRKADRWPACLPWAVVGALVLATVVLAILLLPRLLSRGEKPGRPGTATPAIPKPDLKTLITDDRNQLALKFLRSERTPGWRGQTLLSASTTRGGAATIGTLVAFSPDVLETEAEKLLFQSIPGNARLFFFYARVQNVALRLTPRQTALVTDEGRTIAQLPEEKLTQVLAHPRLGHFFAGRIIGGPGLLDTGLFAAAFPLTTDVGRVTAVRLAINEVSVAVPGKYTPGAQ